MIPKRAALRALALLLTLFLHSCSSGISLMVYNVENLFDDVYDGTEYREFDPRGGKWTTELFRARIDAVAEVIRRAVPGGPDILVLQEIENENALRTLADRGLRGLDYTRAVLVPQKGMAANLAVLTRLPVSRVHSLWVADRKGTGGRDIVEIEILHGGRLLHVFNNHWKSKIEGARETENARISAAGILAERVRKILEADPAADVVVAGDMNESSDEFTRVSGKYPTALMPYSRSIPTDRDQDGILLASAASEAGLDAGRLVLYDPWCETEEEARGSYRFRGGWETVDHILMTGGLFDSRAFSYRRGSFRVYRESFLLLPDGTPKKWEGFSGRKGYSDHLPLLVTLDIDQ
jgi:endonuclease/exonuclease/phosphatase family metal-dependent hydrolase